MERSDRLREFPPLFGRKTFARHRVVAYVLLLAFVTLVVTCGGALGFKSEDFKTCESANFCSRLRGITSTAYAVDPTTVKVTPDGIKATVSNKDEAKGAFELSLMVYDDGVVRMRMTEPEAQRFEVQDVLLPSLETHRAKLEVTSQSKSSIKFKVMDRYTFVLKYDPIRLDVSENSWEPLLSWNAGGNFAFEHHREEKDDDPDGMWKEKFKDHTDSKPRGPEAISFDIEWPQHGDVYGIPEHATSMSLKATLDENGHPVSEPYRLYNLDVFEYEHESPFGLYGSIPFMFAHKKGHTMGAFWLNSAEMYVDVAKVKKSGTKTQWISESGILDLFFLMGPTPRAVSQQYAMLTGGTALPQYFALGYHQCRWNYKDEEDVRQVDGGFDRHVIPYDVIWLDIEHTDGKRYFSWDSGHFPNPSDMQNGVASRGRKMVTVIDPHIKKDPGWEIYDEAKSNEYFVKRDESDFEGWCWPGASMYPDWLSDKVRDWWAGRFSLSKYIGSTTNLYTWNDMNEPSVFNGPEITMHKDIKHVGGAEHRDVHNIFGFYYHMASADGQRRRSFSSEAGSPDGDRPFVLSRAFFSGSQRIGPIWTGDNGADWDHLAVSIPMVVSIGLAGLPFNGADVGGFFGNPDAELMTRWYQLGAYYPFFRGHAHLESNRREPWLFGKETTDRIRAAIRQRYRLLPYFYTQFFHSNISGTPILRPLWYEFPEEDNLSTKDHIFMAGPALLVAPVVKQGEGSVFVTLPGNDIWFDFASGGLMDSSKHNFEGFSTRCSLDDGAKVYIRGGSIVVTKERARRSSAAMVSDPFTLYVALNLKQTSIGDIYLDDGQSFAFQKGQYLYRKLEFKNGILRNTEGSIPLQANLPTPDKKFHVNREIEKIVILGLQGGSRKYKAYLNGVGLDAAPGPVQVSEGLAPIGLVIRKPGVQIGETFSIKINKIN